MKPSLELQLQLKVNFVKIVNVTIKKRVKKQKIQKKGEGGTQRALKNRSAQPEVDKQQQIQPKCQT